MSILSAEISHDKRIPCYLDPKATGTPELTLNFIVQDECFPVSEISNFFIAVNQIDLWSHKYLVTGLVLGCLGILV